MSNNHFTTPAPLLLAAWSVTTTQREKFEYWNNVPYRDSPRSTWEAAAVHNSTIAAWMRGTK